MPSYPQRAGYPNHIIKNTLPSSQSLWDIYAITAVVFLKDRQVAMCPLVSILSRGTLLEKSNSLICPSLWESEHQTPHRDLQRTLKEDLLNLSAMLYVGPQSLSLWVTVDPPITVILFERINQRKKIQIQTITSYGLSPPSLSGINLFLLYMLQALISYV